MASHQPSYSSRLVAAAVLSVMLFASHGCKGEKSAGDVQWHRYTADYHRFARTAPYSLHYLDIGKGAPVIFVHGWADSTYTWHNSFPELMRTGLRFILVDQPGMGRSATPPEPRVYSIENQARAVMLLADHLNLDRFALVGHSMGGAIVLYICLHHPQRVQRAIAIAPACYEPSARAGRWLLKIPGVTSLAEIFAGRWAVARGLREVYYNDALVTDTLIDEYTRISQRPGYVEAITSLALDFFSPAHVQMQRAYGRITAPLLIIWGQRDRWLPPSMGRRLNKLIRNSRLVVIPDAGHNVHQEAAVQVNQAMQRFLAATDP